MQESIQTYIKRRLKHLEKLLLEFRDSGDSKQLHGIRIEIKKIKAVLELIKYNDNGFNFHKTYRPFSVIFKACGSIREKQIMYALARKNHMNKLPAPPDHSDEIGKLRSDMPDYIKMLRSIGKLVIKDAAHIDADTYKQYITKKLKQIRKLLYPVLDQEQLHYTRKQIKAIVFLLTVKKKEIPAETFLKQGAALIGDWHDNILLIEWLKDVAPKRQITIKNLQSANRQKLKDLKHLVVTFYSAKKN